MKIVDIVGEAVETLANSAALRGIPVIREDAGDVSAKLQAEVAKCCVAVVVGWNGFTPVIQGETSLRQTPVGEVGLVCTVYERPVVNRARPGAKIVTSIALAVAAELNGASAEGMAAPLWLKKIGKVMSLDDREGTVFCDIDFETKASLN